jgi:tripartite motif-containing protein 2/3/tripartite motif-containing protein 71
VDGAGNVFVTDCYNHRIQVFNNEGGVVLVFGQEGSGERELKYPQSKGPWITFLYV